MSVKGKAITRYIAPRPREVIIRELMQTAEMLGCRLVVRKKDKAIAFYRLETGKIVFITKDGGKTMTIDEYVEEAQKWWLEKDCERAKYFMGF